MFMYGRVGHTTHNPLVVDSSPTGRAIFYCQYVQKGYQIVTETSVALDRFLPQATFPPKPAGICHCLFQSVWACGKFVAKMMKTICFGFSVCQVKGKNFH